MTDFEKIYQDHFSNVYKYILSISQNEAIAEDVVQETFFKAMKNIKQFNGKCKLYVWLCQIAKNTYYDIYKKQKKYNLTSNNDDSSSEANLEINYIDKETSRKLHILLHKMKEPYKEIFTLRVFGELSFSQIGEIFDKTDSYARLIFYRAKKKLQEDLK